MIDQIPWVQIALAALAGVLTGTAVPALMSYFSNLPKNKADAREKDVSADITVGEAWQRYATAIKAQYEEIQKQYAHMQTMYDELRDKHTEIIEQKDKEINALRGIVKDLQERLRIHETTKTLPKPPPEATDGVI